MSVVSNPAMTGVPDAPQFQRNSNGQPTGALFDPGTGNLLQSNYNPYLGQVTTNCAAPTNNNAGLKQANSRSMHVATQDLQSLQLVFANWYGLTEQNSGTLTITAAIEYPLGTTAQQVLFSGSASAVMASGTNLRSDVLQLTNLIPKGATFAVRSFQVQSVGLIYLGNGAGGGNTAIGECCQFAASGLTDLTLSAGGGTFANSGAAIYKPICIVAQTVQPSFMLLGDSRISGAMDTTWPASPSDALGEFQRSVSAQPSSNMGLPGELFYQFSLTHALRAQLVQYFTHIFMNEGTNDFASGSYTSAQVLGFAATLNTYPWNSRQVWLATVAPRTTSTDNWATVANQTPVTGEAQRVAYNTSLRTSPPSWVAGIFDVAAQVESSLNSGAWKATGSAFGYTADGIHETTAGNLLIQNSAIINPLTNFHR